MQRGGGQVSPGPWPGALFVLLTQKGPFWLHRVEFYAKSKICQFFLGALMPRNPRPPPPHGVNPGFVAENITKVQQIHNECILVQTEWPDLAAQSTKNVVGKRYKMSKIWYRLRQFGTCNRKVQSEYFLIQTLKNLVRE